MAGVTVFPPPAGREASDREGPSERTATALYLASISLAGLVFYFAPPTALSLAGLLAFAALGGRRPRLALLPVVFSFPFYLRPRTYGELSFAPTECLLLALAVGMGACWLWSALPSLAFRRPAAGWAQPLAWRDVFALPALLFLLACLLSLSQAEHLREGLRSLRTVVVEPLLLYGLVLWAGGGQRQARRLVEALILAAVAICLIGFYQYFFTDQVITAEDVRRMKAFYGSPNNLGLFLGRVAPLSAALAVFCPRRRWLWAAATGVVLASILLTFSIGAWIGAAAGLLLVAWLAGGRARWVVIGLGSLSLVASVPLGRVERVASHFSLESGTNLLRLQLWQSAANMLRDHPLLGVGLDNFLYQYQRYGLGEVVWKEPSLSHPHNLVLDFWLSAGLLGLVAMLWLLGAFFWRATSLYRSSQGPLERALAVGAMGSMLDLVIHGTIDNSYFLLDLASIFWLSLGVVRLLERARAEAELEGERQGYAAESST